MLFYAVTAVVIFLFGLERGGLGGTLGALTTSLMTLVVPADEALGILLPIMLVADVVALWLHWGNWDKRHVVLTVPSMLAGLVVATWFLGRISAETLRPIIGCFVLLFVIYKLLENRIVNSYQYEFQRWHGVAAGSAGGFGTTLAHIGGPPIIAYLLFQKLPPRTFVATSVLTFAIVNWIKIPSYLYVGILRFEQFGQIVWLLPVLPLGLWVGRQLADKIDKQRFDWLIVSLLLVAALFLLR